MKLPHRRQFLHLAAGAAALPASAFGQGTIIPTNATMIVERTQYFAKVWRKRDTSRITTSPLSFAFPMARTSGCPRSPAIWSAAT